MSYLGFEDRFLDLTDREAVVPIAGSLGEIRERLNRHFGWIPERYRRRVVHRFRAGRTKRRAIREDGSRVDPETCRA
jgi:hypothetical protein